MADPDAALPAELAGRFRSEVVLKRDQLSTIERGYFTGPNGDAAAVLRRIDQVPLWAQLPARLFLKREARALRVAGPLGSSPVLLHLGSTVLVRSWLPGLPLQMAKPTGDIAYFRSAKAALRALHRHFLTHNDLAKQPNWLRAEDGTALLTDFQLATIFRRRSRVFRLMAHEDIRHLLKHKRTYCPDALTPSERRMLARQVIVGRIWLALGKPVYRLITRGVFRHADREGGGRRLIHDAPEITKRLRGRQTVREVAVVAYPDRRRGVGLYAFVEGAPGESEAEIRAFLASAPNAPRPPELIQIVPALPRDSAGAVRTEILQVIALNQIDSLGGIVATAEKPLVDAIVAGRLNLLDRHAGLPAR